MVAGDKYSAVHCLQQSVGAPTMHPTGSLKALTGRPLTALPLSDMGARDSFPFVFL